MVVVVVLRLDAVFRVRSVELKENGANIRVTEENKKEYVHLVCQHKMTQAVRPQLNAFLKGFNELVGRYVFGGARGMRLVRCRVTCWAACLTIESWSCSYRGCPRSM